MALRWKSFVSSGTEIILIMAIFHCDLVNLVFSVAIHTPLYFKLSLQVYLHFWKMLGDSFSWKRVTCCVSVKMLEILSEGLNLDLWPVWWCVLLVSKIFLRVWWSTEPILKSQIWFSWKYVYRRMANVKLVFIGLYLWKCFFFPQDPE